MRDSPYSVPRSLSGQYRSVSAGVEHRQLVDLAQKHFGSVSGAYTEDTVPSLAPCRFTGSQVGRGSALSWHPWVHGYLHDSRDASGGGRGPMAAASQARVFTFDTHTPPTPGTFPGPLDS